jgi:glycine betaine/proline transport system substrate-binding protein
MQRNISRLWSVAAFAVVTTLLVAACGGGAANAPKPTIKIAENPWTGAEVNVAVAKNLLESKLGYKVEVVKVDEFAQWAALQKGDLSVSLEVWPSGHADDIKNYVDKGLVENIGNLGPIGQIGWFTPTYVIDAHPELKTSDGLKDPANAALFKTAETGDKGQFLEGDPSWTYYDNNIITNLGLDFKVVQAGSEDAMFAAVDAAYQRQQPVLFYYWTPNWAFGKYKLTKIDLPKYTPECYAGAPDSVACDYPPDVLFKVADPKLKDTAPDAYAFLKAMNYSNDDQIAMIYDVVANKKTADDAAAAWIAANEAKWSAWIPKP